MNLLSHFLLHVLSIMELKAVRISGAALASLLQSVANSEEADFDGLILGAGLALHELPCSRVTVLNNWAELLSW